MKVETKIKKTVGLRCRNGIQPKDKIKKIRIYLDKFLKKYKV